MKKVLRIVVDVLAWILLIFAMLITLLVFTSSKNNGVSNIFGLMFMSVQSDSMSPTFKEGDMILVKKVDDLYTLKEGDVITFYTIVDGSRIINTHRIVKINQAENSRSFVTRGDNNPVDDTLPAYASDILGKWTGTRLPKMGSFLDFLKTKTGFFICVIIPIALFFIFELYKFISALIEAKKPKISDEDEEEIKRKAVEEYLAKEAAKKAAEAETAEAAGGAEAAAGAVAENASDEVVKAAEEVSDTVAKAEEAVENKAEEAVEKAADAVENNEK
jgi:signal peptidase